jgi:hypothetical protein
MAESALLRYADYCPALDVVMVGEMRYAQNSHEKNQPLFLDISGLHRSSLWPFKSYSWFVLTPRDLEKRRRLITRVSA